MGVHLSLFLTVLRTKPVVRWRVEEDWAGRHSGSTCAGAANAKGIADEGLKKTKVESP